MTTENERLNAMPHYKDRACVRCARKYPDTLLNVEGNIHHREPYRCLDRKACGRAVRRSVRRDKRKCGAVVGKSKFEPIVGNEFFVSKKEYSELKAYLSKGEK